MEHRDGCQCSDCVIPLEDVPMLVALGVIANVQARVKGLDADHVRQIAEAVEQRVRKELLNA